MGSAQSPQAVPQQILAPLRDFFMARDERQLQEAYADIHALLETLRQDTGAPAAPAPEGIDWEQAIFGFNRLFVGPKALLAPPYASVWLDPEPFLMGEATMEARHVYEMLGLGSPLRNKLPDDHLSLELDVLMAMHVSLACREAPPLRDLRRHFLERHVLRWMPQFCDRVLELEETPSPVAVAANTLLSWLEATQQELHAEESGSRTKAQAALSGSSATSDQPEVRS